MERLTLREAAHRTSRSVTTLRRYIRSGRLAAEKLAGRFGPEYFVAETALADAGLDLVEPVDPSEALVPATSHLPVSSARPHPEAVPLSLFLELQMKHEQLLVQYGMVRVAGLRTMELQAELDARKERVTALEDETVRLRDRLTRESAALRKRLAEVELDLEGTRIEAEALRGKVRTLEMFRRNASTSDAIDRRFDAVLDQLRLVESLDPGAPEAGTPRRPASPPADRPQEH